MWWARFIAIDRESQVEVPGFAWPLALYAAITLISTVFSPDPRVSLMADKQDGPVLLVPLVYRVCDQHLTLSTMVTVIVSPAGRERRRRRIVQFGVLHYDIPLDGGSRARSATT